MVEPHFYTFLYAIQIGQLPREAVYIINLQTTHCYFSLMNGAALAIAECDREGKLNNRYCLLEKTHFCIILRSGA